MNSKLNDNAHISTISNKAHSRHAFFYEVFTPAISSYSIEHSSLSFNPSWNRTHKSGTLLHTNLSIILNTLRVILLVTSTPQRIRRVPNGSPFATSSLPGIRRLRPDLILYYKMFNNLVCINSCDHFSVFTSSSLNTRSEVYLLHWSNAYTLFNNFFS